MNAAVRDRFFAKVDRTGACWLWLAATDDFGYGRFHVDEDRHMAFAHRVAYELLVGEIPEGREIHHMCDVPSCVNPDHLVAVTRQQHGLLNRNALRTHCAHGHAYDEQNTYIRDGKRYCRTCRSAAQARRRAHLKAVAA